MASAYAKYFGTGPALVVHQQHKTAAELGADLKRRSDTEDGVIAARGALHDAVVQRSQAISETAATFDAVR